MLKARLELWSPVSAQLQYKAHLVIMSKSDAFELFPTPSHLHKGELLPPRVWPGHTPASIATLRQILKDNHEKWHIYFNTRGFHK